MQRRRQAQQAAALAAHSSSSLRRQQLPALAPERCRPWSRTHSRRCRAGIRQAAPLAATWGSRAHHRLPPARARSSGAPLPHPAAHGPGSSPSTPARPTAAPQTLHRWRIGCSVTTSARWVGRAGGRAGEGLWGRLAGCPLEATAAPPAACIPEVDPVFHSPADSFAPLAGAFEGRQLRGAGRGRALLPELLPAPPAGAVRGQQALLPPLAGAAQVAQVSGDC